jgi:hypothetical protein
MSTSPEPQPLGVVLNANQRRHYGILIAGLEATLEKIEAAVAGPPPATGLARVLPDLPSAFREGAAPILARLRDDLRRIAKGLSLETHPISQRQTCRALLTSEINRVEESYSSHLRGYGAVDETLGTVLDPMLRDVRADLGTLASLLAVPRS